MTVFRSFCLSIYPSVCNPYLCHRFILKKLRRHSLKQTAAHCSPKLYGSKFPSLQVGGRSAAVSPPPRLCTGRTSVSKSSAFRGNTKPRGRKKSKLPYTSKLITELGTRISEWPETTSKFQSAQNIFAFQTRRPFERHRQLPAGRGALREAPPKPHLRSDASPPETAQRSRVFAQTLFEIIVLKRQRVFVLDAKPSSLPQQFVDLSIPVLVARTVSECFQRQANFQFRNIFKCKVTFAAGRSFYYPQKIKNIKIGAHIRSSWLHVILNV